MHVPRLQSELFYTRQTKSDLRRSVNSPQSLSKKNSQHVLSQGEVTKAKKNHSNNRDQFNSYTHSGQHDLHITYI